MTDSSWWDAPSKQSQVKTNIVVEYFQQWARVMAGNAEKSPSWPDRIAYVDLFAGRGFYGDDTPSTPLRVIEAAAALPSVRSRIDVWLNDAAPDSYAQLRQAVASLKAGRLLDVPPKVTNLAIDLETVRHHVVPRPATLFFLDPWGYKGLSLELVRRATQAEGSECILFFNFNRIYMGVENPVVEAHMASLFGEDRFAAMLPAFRELSRAQREDFLMKQARAALESAGARFVLNFRFLNDTGSRTSHYVIHVTDGELGNDIMRAVMKRHCSPTADGIPEFVYDPARDGQTRMELFDGHSELSDELCSLFAGQTLRMRTVYQQYRDGSASRAGCVPSDIKEALKRLELERRITAHPPAATRRWRNGQPTFHDDVMVTFPPRKAG